MFKFPFGQPQPGTRFSGNRMHRRRVCISAIVEALEPRTLLSTYVVANLNDSGAGSLRAAVQQANANAGADTISFATGLSGTITLTSGQLALTDASGLTTIAGPGAGVLAVSGNNANTVFSIGTGATAAINNLTVTGGSTGGAGGGIYNGGTLTLTGCTLSGDHATGLGSDGGGIGNGGRLYVTGCTLTNDTAGFSGGAISNNQGSITITGCTIFDNSAPDFGGAIDNSSTLIIAQSTFADNSVTSESAGGGVMLNRASGKVTITACTFSGDTSASVGGVFETGGTLTLINSTISGNTATGNRGAGIDNYNSGVLSVTNCTISGNNGGGISQYGSSAVLNNTIVTGNTNHGAATANDIASSSSLVTGSNNLIGTGGAGGLVNGTSGNQVGVSVANTKLGPLQNNGGPTQTMALLAGSPAIDAGNNSLIPSGVTTDQRGSGFPRVANATVDIGAFESASMKAQKYVTQLYSDVLDRTPDSGGLDYWAGQLDSGAALQAVAAGIENSNESNANVVTSLYENILGRAPDAGGLAYWTDQLDAGASVNSIRNGFFASNEYYADQGGTAAGWIDAVYMYYLDRAADSGGLSYWEGVLAAGGPSASDINPTRLSAANYIGTSQEYYNDVVTNAYEKYFLSAPDSGGLAYWSNALYTGTLTVNQFIVDLVTSTEYFTAHNLTQF